MEGMSMGMMGGGGDTAFTYKSLIFAMSIMILLPMAIAIFVPSNDMELQDEVLDGYYQMTGQDASTKVSIWPLSGVYRPYSGGAYGYTDDGWLFGSELKMMSPDQYLNTNQQFTVYKDEESGVFRYYIDSADYDPDTGTGHRGTYHIATTQSPNYDNTKPVSKDNYTVGDLVPYGELGELYNAVVFDRTEKSSIFFMESQKHEQDGFFYYDYDGLRMSFQPISNYTAVDADGNKKPVVATTTSLSLIWYQYYNVASGISGNLVLSGSSSGLAYINAAQILSAFNSTNNTASFDMVFNGITMTIIFRLDPYYLSQGYTVEDVYNNGWWSILVTSLSADSSAYTGTDFSANPARILDTVIDVFTFDYTDYNISGWLGTVCSLVFMVCLYGALIAICLDHAYLWVIVGILAAVQTIATFSFW